MILNAQNLTKSYGTLQVLKGVSLTITDPEVLCITGPSGAGKSTLLHLLGTLDKPDSGILEIKEQPILQLSDKALSKFRNQNVGFVFQAHHLLPEFTALENVCIPAYIANTSKKTIEKKAKELLDLLGIGARCEHKPNQMSGGEQQRVAMARALINNPTIVFADEPSGNLDTKNANDLHHLFLTLKQQLQQTFVIVTHNEAMATIADKRMIMRDGEVIQIVDQRNTTH